MSDRRVLLVDPDVKLLRLVQATLALKSVETVAAQSAEQAAAILRAYAPDLVITDVELPDLSGLDMLRRVRALPGLSDVPFLFLTVHADQRLVERGAAFGGTGFVRKPFAVEELLGRVLTVLNDAPGGRDAAASSVSGSLKTTALPDVLRMLVVQGRTGTLTIVPRGGRTEGTIYLRAGRVIHAAYVLLTGIDALYALLLVESGAFDFVDGEPSAPPLIIEATLPLLMEGYRLIDEGLIRRIDPRQEQAARMFTRLVERHRQPTPLAGDSGASVLTGRTETVETTAEDLATVSADFDVGLLTEDFAPDFDDEELAALEAELEREFDEPALGTIVVSPQDDEDDEDVCAETIRLSPAGGDPESVKAVALVDDTIAELEPVQGMTLSGRKDTEVVMGFYGEVLASAREDLGAHSVQLGTRKGRVITSSIPEGTRRDTVAAFSREAIQFASEDSWGNRFASLDAGDLHVLVVEVDHVRLLTLLFSQKPEPQAVLEILAGHLEVYRGAR